MSVARHLAGLALRPLVGSQVEQAAQFLKDHRSDHSRKLPAALGRANERAWRAVEVALAGDSWWQRLQGMLGRGEDRAVAQQLRSFLDTQPLRQFEGQPATL